MKHTPTPYEAYRGEQDCYNHESGHYTAPNEHLDIVMGEMGDNSIEVYGPDQEANAEFIVLACNAHADLLEACKGFIAYYDEYLHYHIVPHAITQPIRAAIAKATEGGE